MLFEILFGQILEVSFGEGNVGFYVDFGFIIGDLDIFSELSDSAVDFDSLSKEFCEI